MASLRFLDELVEMRSFGGCENSRDVGDQCLITAGLFPEHAIERGIPITYFVQAGTHAYLEYHGRARQELYGYLASSFVACMDVLQTLRESENGEPCIDAVNAYDLWWEAGSSHAWRALRHFTPALPGGQTTGNFH